MSHFLGETLIDTVLDQLYQLYYSKNHGVASASSNLNTEHIDVGTRSRFSFCLEDILVNGGIQKQPQQIFELIKGLDEHTASTHPSDKEIDWSIKNAFILLDSLAVDESTKLVLQQHKPLSKEEGYFHFPWLVHALY